MNTHRAILPSLPARASRPARRYPDSANRHHDGANTEINGEEQHQSGQRANLQRKPDREPLQPQSPTDGHQLADLVHDRRCAQSARQPADGDKRVLDDRAISPDRDEARPLRLFVQDHRHVMGYPDEQQPADQKQQQITAQSQRHIGRNAGCDPVEQLQTNHRRQTERDCPERANRRGPIDLDELDAIGSAARQQQRALNARGNASDHAHPKLFANRVGPNTRTTVPRLTAATKPTARHGLSARPCRARNQFIHSA